MNENENSKTPTPVSNLGWENEEKLTVEQAWTILCETPDITSPEEYPDHALITMEQLGSFMDRAIPVGTITCPCTTFEQDEDCPVGFPSLLCAACGSKGVATLDKVVALAAEMMKVDELEGPFAAWETIDLLKSREDQLRKAIEWCLGRDSRNGSLPKSYEDKLRAALSATATEGE